MVKLLEDLEKKDEVKEDESHEDESTDHTEETNEEP